MKRVTNRVLPVINLRVMRSRTARLAGMKIRTRRTYVLISRNTITTQNKGRLSTNTDGYRSDLSRLNQKITIIITRRTQTKYRRHDVRINGSMLGLNRTLTRLTQGLNSNQRNIIKRNCSICMRKFKLKQRILVRKAHL